MLFSFGDTCGWRWHILHAALLISRLMQDFQFLCYHSSLLKPKIKGVLLEILSVYKANHKQGSLDNPTADTIVENCRVKRATMQVKDWIQGGSISDMGKRWWQSLGKGDPLASNSLNGIWKTNIKPTTLPCLQSGFRVKCQFSCLWGQTLLYFYM